MNRSLAGLIFLLTSGSLLADTVPVAVASNFAAPVASLATAFTQQTGHRLQVSTGASGKFYAQISNGAPFEVFLSADSEKPAQLERAGLAVAGSRFTYAIGKLVLWSADPGRVDAEGQVLTSGQFDKLAIANAKTAPYGEAAMQTLVALKLTASVAPKLVMGENINQTYQFVASGNAPLGFVALSQVQRDQRLVAGSAWLVPATLYAPIRQDAVLLKRGEAHLAAREFLQFLRSSVATQIIRSYGYDTH